MSRKWVIRVAKEHANYRETVAMLRERFNGNDSISGVQLAKYLGMNPAVCYREISNGNLPGKKIGKIYVITISQLANWECKKGGV